MNNVNIIGDSLASSRPDFLRDNQRWPSLLQQQLTEYRVHNFAKGFSTSEYLKKLGFLKVFKNDVLVVQIGVVDCAPRLLSKLENKVIARFPLFLAKRIIQYLKKNRIQSEHRSYVMPSKFELNILNFFNRYPNTNIIYIKILPASAKFISSNPYIGVAINKYNSIIDVCASKYKNVHLIELNDLNIEDYTLEDGYHLNKEGHLLISNLISSYIKNNLYK
ncbi:MAG: SGNH/GDSL hydrolase family protein [Sphingobacteriaceae bacterium]